MVESNSMSEWHAICSQAEWKHLESAFMHGKCTASCLPIMHRQYPLYRSLVTPAPAWSCWVCCLVGRCQSHHRMDWQWQLNCLAGEGCHWIPHRCTALHGTEMQPTHWSRGWMLNIVEPTKVSRVSCCGAMTIVLVKGLKVIMMEGTDTDKECQFK